MFVLCSRTLATYINVYAGLARIHSWLMHVSHLVRHKRRFDDKMNTARAHICYVMAAF